MGLLVCLIAYALGLAGSLGAVAQVKPDTVDPEGVGLADPGVLMMIAAVATLSALIGARKHQEWLSRSIGVAVICGVAGGALTGAILIAFGALTTWGSNPIFAVILVVARLTFILWPALVLKAVIAGVQRLSIGPGPANAV